MLLGRGALDGVRLLNSAMVDTMIRNHLSDHQCSLEALGQLDFFAHSGFSYGVEVVIEPAPPL